MLHWPLLSLLFLALLIVFTNQCHHDTKVLHSCTASMNCMLVMSLLVIILFQLTYLYMFILLCSLLFISCMSFVWKSGLGYFCLGYSCFLCLLINITHPEYVIWGSPNQSSHVHVYHMSMPSLLHPVPVSSFMKLGMIFMIMFMGVSFLVIQSGLPSDIICLESHFLVVLDGSIIITFLPPIITWCMHLRACYSMGEILCQAHLVLPLWECPNCPFPF